MTEQQLTFLQHLREFGLVYQRKVTLASRRYTGVMLLKIVVIAYGGRM